MPALHVGPQPPDRPWDAIPNSSVVTPSSTQSRKEYVMDWSILNLGLPLGCPEFEPLTAAIFLEPTSSNKLSQCHMPAAATFHTAPIPGPLNPKLCQSPEASKGFLAKVKALDAPFTHWLKTQGNKS